MGKYNGPKVRIIRRLGLLPGLTRKEPKNRLKTPGEHGKIVFRKTRRSSLSDDYKDRLIEKQKIRFNYGISEKQLISYYSKAKKAKGSTGTLLLELIESRLDCVVYRLGFAPSIPAARQLVNHGHILVNNRCVNIPSFLCQQGDQLSVREKERSKALVGTSFEKQQEKRKLISRRMQRVKGKISRKVSTSLATKLLPSHLSVDPETYLGTFLSVVKRKDLLIRVNELKVVEYYSR